MSQRQFNTLYQFYNKNETKLNTSKEAETIIPGSPTYTNSPRLSHKID